MTFSATVKTGTSMKCWCTMPMPAAMASPGPAKRDGRAVDAGSRPSSGVVEAVEHVHQRGLAGAVLAQQGVDLARLDDEVDVVVGDQRAEALGDAAQLELHAARSFDVDGAPAISGRGSRVRGRHAGAAAGDARAVRRAWSSGVGSGRDAGDSTTRSPAMICRLELVDLGRRGSGGDLARRSRGTARGRRRRSPACRRTARR